MPNRLSTEEVMIQLFNSLLECFVTGLFCALSLWVMGFFGLFPMIIMVPEEKKEKKKNDSDN